MMEVINDIDSFDKEKIKTGLMDKLECESSPMRFKNNDQKLNVTEIKILSLTIDDATKEQSDEKTENIIFDGVAQLEIEDGGNYKTSQFDINGLARYRDGEDMEIVNIYYNLR